MTFRQELFLREYMKTHVGAESWQRVYKTNRQTARIMSCRTLHKPHVAKRLNELRAQVMQKKDITVEKVLDDYQLALNMAKAQGKASEIVAAATAQAKLVGLLRERVETGQVGDFGDMNSISDVLEMVGREAGPEAAMVLASMFGVKLPESEVTKEAQEAALFISDPASDAVN
jgi:hypothetical protein